jgi:hypothetical protein
MVSSYCIAASIRVASGEGERGFCSVEKLRLAWV